MTSTQKLQKLQKEGRMALSKQALQNNQSLSLYRAAKLYSVPRASLQLRIKGLVLIAQSNAKKQKLQLSKEQSLI